MSPSKLNKNSVTISTVGPVAKHKFFYVSITASSEKQAKQIKKQILEKIDIDGKINTF